MGALVRDILLFGLGMGQFGFSWALWAFVTIVLLLVGTVLAVVGGRTLDPIASLAAGRPLRVARWLPISLLASVAMIAFFALSVIFAPVAVIVAFGLLVLGVLGYLALAMVLGDVVVRVGRAGAAFGAASSPAPWVAMLVGVLLLRLVRIVPLVGAPLHLLAAWVAFAAASAVAWDIAWSWHRRRLPDHVQFEGETLIEWYPDGDPEEGPSVGTGRPVLGNLRGEEDRELPAWRRPPSTD